MRCCVVSFDSGCARTHGDLRRLWRPTRRALKRSSEGYLKPTTIDSGLTKVLDVGVAEPRVGHPSLAICAGVADPSGPMTIC
jgi:hypothetical protein